MRSTNAVLNEKWMENLLIGRKSVLSYNPKRTVVYINANGEKTNLHHECAVSSKWKENSIRSQ